MCLRGTDRILSNRAGILCRELALSTLANRVQVRWNSRMRSTAGRATWPDAEIELNPALAQISESEVERTFLHELAHLVAYARAGNRRIRPHGPEWRQACCDLGIPGERAGHTLPLPSRTLRRKWRYFCPGCWGIVERVRRMRGHSACYACCLKHNHGEYDERFRFVEKRIGG
ncbi:MAG: SprT family zinc-dependent metalloprotease [Akkermansiaceae bacterium]|nr:SprT family zinc-dependent metalloprotease [Akkermansiaceae bacterium]